MPAVFSEREKLLFDSVTSPSRGAPEMIRASERESDAFVGIVASGDVMKGSLYFDVVVACSQTCVSLLLAE